MKFLHEGFDVLMGVGMMIARTARWGAIADDAGYFLNQIIESRKLFSSAKSANLKEMIVVD